MLIKKAMVKANKILKKHNSSREHDEMLGLEVTNRLLEEEINKEILIMIKGVQS